MWWGPAAMIERELRFGALSLSLERGALIG